MSAASVSARAFTSLDDGAGAGTSADIDRTGVEAGRGVERHPAGEVAEDPADAPGVQPGQPADLLARVPGPAEAEDELVLGRAGGEQGVPHRPGPGVLARPGLVPGQEVVQVAQ